MSHTMKFVEINFKKIRDSVCCLNCWRHKYLSKTRWKIGPIIKWMGIIRNRNPTGQ